MRTVRENRRITLFALLSAVAIFVSFAVVSTQFSTGAQTQSMTPGTTLAVSCSGTSLATESTSQTTVNLNCLAKASVPPIEVGAAKTFASTSSSHPTTAIPAGTKAGDLLLSYVESYGFVDVHCPAGWTEALDHEGTGGVRIVGCTTVAQGGQAAPVASASPATQISMVTMAFSGVGTTDPVDAAAGASGATSPSVTTATAGTLLVFGEGSNAWRQKTRGPTGTSLAATVNDGGDAQLAAATKPFTISGQTPPVAWPGIDEARSVSATIALRPAAASSGSGLTGGGVTPGTLSRQMAAGTALTVSCTGSGLTVTGTSPTAVVLDCLAAQPIAQVGQATTFSGGSSGSPSTSLPSGTSAGDLLVSYVESYAFTNISCDSGWTKALDAANGNGARLVACVTVADVGQSRPVDKVSPPTQVSMVTAAYSGVKASNPVSAAGSAPGLVSPSVSTTNGSALVFGEGSDAWNLVAKAPTGSKLAATVNDQGNSQVAAADDIDVPAGGSGPRTWAPDVSGSQPVAGTLALTPQSDVTPPPTTTTSNPTTTTTTAPTTTTSNPTTTTTTPGNGKAPTVPPAEICGDSSILDGPSSAPSGAVTVPAGNDANVTMNNANTTYWFAPGTHTLGNGQYNQIIPSNGDTYIGAPGAIIDGQNENDYAFTQGATNVSIEYLTIENFGQTGGNNNEGVVNHDSGSAWTIKYDTIEDNAGAGVMMGSNDVVEYNCLTKNGQYGFSAYTPAGPSNITLSHNEISYNDTYNWEVKDPGCGCSGGGKFWDTDGATVTDNYVHDNEDVGIWADTDNTGFDISGNYISNNFAEGVMYEISYNANISDNTFVRNALGEGPQNPGFPTGAIYISESGSDSRVAGPYGNTFEITGNVFDDNWSGVVLWENSDRFCGPDSPDNAGSLCTLVAPSVAKPSTCVTPGIDSEPLFSDCVWKTQNVDVSSNTFDFTPSDIGSDCKASNGCGYVGLFSEYGVTAPYKGWVVPKAIAQSQNDHFSDNTYNGPWSFMGPVQGTTATWAQWTGGYTDNSDGSGIYFDPQDQGSTLNS